MGSARDADVIVIGSGMGGLAAASLLARTHGRRVLVLESHWRAGGFTHTFSRPGGYSWDVGFHHAGADVARPGMPRDVFQVTSGGALGWTKMPDPFERLVFPGFEFDVRSGGEAFRADLTAAFPAEAGAIDAYLRGVRRAAGAMTVLGPRGTAPARSALHSHAVITSHFLQPRTPVAGHYLTGADALMAGLAGAAMAGLMTAVAVAGPSTFGRVKAAARALAGPAATATAASLSAGGTPA
jgi:phytoene dehydrogenase-like protein